MRLDTKMYARLEINNKLAFQLDGSVPFQAGISQFIRWIIDHPMDSRDLSTLAFKFSKRPIVDLPDDLDLVKLIESAGDNVVVMNPDDPMESLFGLTWGEYEELTSQSEWMDAFRLIQSTDRSTYTGMEIDQIKERFHARYFMEPRVFQIFWPKLQNLNRKDVP